MQYGMQEIYSSRELEKISPDRNMLEKERFERETISKL